MEEKETSFLRKNLAVIIRNIQWSYAIFWSLSTTQPELLEWNEGYYNGDIKTRKTTQPSELDSDQWGLQRSMQLRDLYMSISAQGSNNSSTTSNNSSSNNNRRPSASLSPEDLTNLEWYFLVCMSFTFRHGKCVPGRTLAIGRETWLCNVHYADTKIFSRSLLAKSASIQTIVCCPFMNGVLELGTTELVLENPDLIRQITFSFWDIPKFVGHDRSNSSSERKDDDGLTPVVVDGISHLENLNSILDSNIWSENIKREERTISHDQHSSNDLSPPKSQGDDNDDDDDDDDYDEDDSIEVMEISDAEFDDFQRIAVENDGALSHSNKLSSLDVGDEGDSNYRRILTVILENPCQKNKTIPPIFPNSLHSSFVAWKKKKKITTTATHFGRGASQRVLKKILSLNSNPTISNDEISNTAAAAANSNHSNNTLQYIKDLETRVFELETDGKRKQLLSDTNFDKYHGTNKKMKAYDDYNLEEFKPNLSKDSMSDLRVSMIGKDVFIEMFCPWRECLLLDIVDQIANLQLDPHSIQSSIIDGILSLSISSKHLGVLPISSETIKQAIHGVSGKC